jgi:hypothetical protein
MTFARPAPVMTPTADGEVVYANMMLGTLFQTRPQRWSA